MSQNRPHRLDLSFNKTIGTKYVDPRVVAATDGPRLAISVGLHEKLAQLRRVKGVRVPDRIGGIALIDTGATVTTLHVQTATALGLQPTGPVSSYGIGGASRGFAASCSIDIYGVTVNLARAHFHDESALLKSGLIALIGRDILRFFVFQYDGTRGTAYLEIPTSVPNKQQTRTPTPKKTKRRGRR